MSAPRRPPLLAIAGGRAHRYVNGKHTEIAAIDAEAVEDARELRQNLNWFRENGLPPEPVIPGALEIDAYEGGVYAFGRLSHALENNPPAMSPRVKEEACLAV